MSERTVVLKMVVSLDGFATSPDGTHEWMFEWFGDDSNAWSLRALDAAGVHAMGRRSYEIMGPHWAAAIADLKARDEDGTVLVHGGPDLATSLTRLGLVDQYQLMTVPIAIGKGRSPFADLAAHLKLDVVEEQRFRSGALAQILVPRR